ncbi:MAG: hypothetical protein JNL18_10855 [Planctomycetaceae bacterium]|nr:hypothetical protein [Planctomycetaceae bacterium]
MPRHNFVAGFYRLNVIPFHLSLLSPRLASIHKNLYVSIAHRWRIAQQ